MTHYKIKNKLIFHFIRTFNKLRVLLINLCFFHLLFIKSKNTIHENKGLKTILLINTGDLGDNILTFPFILALSECGKYTTYVLSKYAYFESYHQLNKEIFFLSWHKRRYKRNLFYRMKVLLFIRKFHFDIAFNITPERGVINEELTLLSNAVERWKFSKQNPFLALPLKIVLDKKYHQNFPCKSKNEYKNLEDLGEMLGFKPSLQKMNYRRTDCQKKTICIAPFSSDKKRNWDLVNFKLIINELSRDYSVIVLGSASCANLLRNIQEEEHLDLIGKTNISDLFQIIKSSDLFIGNDSGLTHMALHLNIPLIGIIGGGMFGRFFPHHAGVFNRYLYYKMSCYGCSWSCKYRERYCISKVSAGEVLENAYDILNNNVYKA